MSDKWNQIHFSNWNKRKGIYKSFILRNSDLKVFDLKREHELINNELN